MVWNSANLSGPEWNVTIFYSVQIGSFQVDFIPLIKILAELYLYNEIWGLATFHQDTANQLDFTFINYHNAVIQNMVMTSFTFS